MKGVLILYDERNRKQQMGSAAVFAVLAIIILVIGAVIAMYIPVWIAVAFIVVGLIAPLYAVMSSVGYLNIMKNDGHMAGEGRVMTCRIWPQKDGYIFEEIESNPR